MGGPELLIFEQELALTLSARTVLRDTNKWFLW